MIPYRDSPLTLPVAPRHWPGGQTQQEARLGATAAAVFTHRPRTPVPAPSGFPFSPDLEQKVRSLGIEQGHVGIQAAEFRGHTPPPGNHIRILFSHFSGAQKALALISHNNFGGKSHLSRSTGSAAQRASHVSLLGVRCERRVRCESFCKGRPNH